MLIKNASWLDMALFNNFRTLAGTLFVLSLLLKFKEIVLSVWVSKNNLIFKGYSQYFFLENQMKDWLSTATLAK